MKYAANLVLGTLFLVSASTASAITAAAGNDNTGTDNLIRNGCGLAAGSSFGSIVTGCLNSDHLKLVEVGGAGLDLLISGGQATVSAQASTPQSTVPFGMFDVSFADLSQMSKAVVQIGAVADGWISFSSDNVTFTSRLSLNDTGQNFYTVADGPFSKLYVKTWDSDGVGGANTALIGEIKQIRLGMTAPVPEPETYALMLAGLGIIGFMGRRRRSSVD